jgi:acetolactate decarboxylase
VVVPFSPGPPVTLREPAEYAELGRAVGHRLEDMTRPVAVRIEGRFDHVRVRSVPKQRRPYPPLAQALTQERIRELPSVDGTMVGFGFPDALGGIEMTGWHLHFATAARTYGGHVLNFALRHGVAHLDDATELQVELPPAVALHPRARTDQDMLRRLESGP